MEAARRFGELMQLVFGQAQAPAAGVESKNFDARRGARQGHRDRQSRGKSAAETAGKATFGAWGVAHGGDHLAAVVQQGVNGVGKLRLGQRPGGQVLQVLHHQQIGLPQTIGKFVRGEGVHGVVESASEIDRGGFDDPGHWVVLAAKFRQACREDGFAAARGAVEYKRVAAPRTAMNHGQDGRDDKLVFRTGQKVVEHRRPRAGV